MRFRCELVGEVLAEMAAVGAGDAEAQLELMVRRRCAECTVQLLEVRSLAAEPRIAGEYAVRGQIRLTTEIDADSPVQARKSLLREIRSRFEGISSCGVAWEEPKIAALAGG